MGKKKIITCKLCGYKEEISYDDATNRRMKENQHCFSCDFWSEWIKRKDDPKIARIKGTHYYIGEKTNSPASCRGFGGRSFLIKFNDGRTVYTTNLWYQGIIPIHFKKELSDNAVFVED